MDTENPAGAMPVFHYIDGLATLTSGLIYRTTLCQDGNKDTRSAVKTGIAARPLTLILVTTTRLKQRQQGDDIYGSLGQSAPHPLDG